jgi:hypothetical protein
VTAQTAIVIESGGPNLRALMRIVTGKTGKSPVTFSETSAFVQVEGLVADVPGNIPIDLLTRRCRRSMTRSAEFD